MAATLELSFNSETGPDGFDDILTEDSGADVAPTAMLEGESDPGAEQMRMAGRVAEADDLEAILVMDDTGENDGAEKIEPDAQREQTASTVVKLIVDKAIITEAPTMGKRINGHDDEGKDPRSGYDEEPWIPVPKKGSAPADTVPDIPTTGGGEGGSGEPPKPPTGGEGGNEGSDDETGDEKPEQGRGKIKPPTDYSEKELLDILAAHESGERPLTGDDANILGYARWIQIQHRAASQETGTAPKDAPRTEQGSFARAPEALQPDQQHPEDVFSPEEAAILYENIARAGLQEGLDTEQARLLNEYVKKHTVEPRQSRPAIEAPGPEKSEQQKAPELLEPRAERAPELSSLPLPSQDPEMAYTSTEARMLIRDLRSKVEKGDLGRESALEMAIAIRARTPEFIAETQGTVTPAEAFSMASKLLHRLTDKEVLPHEANRAVRAIYKAAGNK